MNNVPDEILLEIVSYLPMKSHLPIANVSKHFHEAWRKKDTLAKVTTPSNSAKTGNASVETNPLQIGNLFLTPWYKPSRINTKLLAYYIGCGWNYPRFSERIIRQCISRGDIEGLQFLIAHKLAQPNDADYCAVAAAAGQLDTLKWLVESQNCPWDPQEVYQESCENLHAPIMNYVDLKVFRGFDTRACKGMECLGEEDVASDMDPIPY